MLWNAETLKIVDEMRAKGCPRREIAQRLGTTISAIAGALARRAGYKKPPRGAPGNMNKVPRKDRPPRQPKAEVPQVPRLPRKVNIPPGVFLISPGKDVEPPTLPQADEILETGTGFTLLEMSFFKCKWPVGKNSDGVFLFCGDDGYPWCEKHRPLAIDMRKTKRSA